MKIVGIDPGLDGAIAIMEGPKALTIVRVPTCAAKGKGREIMWDQLADESLHLMFEADHAFIEQVGVRPHQSAAAGVKQGVNAGGIIGMVVASRIPRTIVPSSTWKIQMGLVTSQKTTKAKKDRSRMRAAEIWPHMTHEFSKSGDDGAAEAALLAYWGYTQIKQRGMGDDAN